MACGHRLIFCLHTPMTTGGLIVTGPHRGSMWFDARAACVQVLPPNLDGRVVSFADWLGRRSMDLLGR